MSKKLKEKGYRVIGVDASEDMIEMAKQIYPEISFLHADASQFFLAEKADVIFSNAVMHWIDREKQEDVIKHIVSQLKGGGQYVCEFGGKGCAEMVHSALESVFAEHGYSYRRTFYFPTIGEYVPLLERHGLRVHYAVLFDRPTPQKNADGLEAWIKMFVKKPFEGLEDTEREEIIQTATERLRPFLYKEGQWFVDYVRIRIKAQKLEEQG